MTIIFLLYTLNILYDTNHNKVYHNNVQIVVIVVINNYKISFYFTFILSDCKRNIKKTEDFVLFIKYTTVRNLVK